MPPHPSTTLLSQSAMAPTIIDIRHNTLNSQKTRSSSSHADSDSLTDGESRSSKAPTLVAVDTTPLSTMIKDSIVGTNDQGLILDHSAVGKRKDSGTTMEVFTPAEETEQQQEEQQGFDLPKMILDGLTIKQTNGEKLKTIPTLVLYDDRGLQIYDEITNLEEYYLFGEEIEILQRESEKIVDLIPDHSVVVELGAGSLRKTVLLLETLNKRRRNIRYYALDLMLDELTKSLVSLGEFENIQTAGLWGTYDQGMAFISSFPKDVPKTLMWLGSSIGNMTRQEAVDFMSSYRQRLNIGDTWLIGMDRRNSAQDITLAYNDPKGVTRDFIMNGLDHINVILEQPFLDRNKFCYFARYNEQVGRHEAYYKVTEAHQAIYRPLNGADAITVDFELDELINVEYSYKWSLAESRQLFESSELIKVGQWTSSSSRYDLHLLQKPAFYNKSTLPTLVSGLSSSDNDDNNNDTKVEPLPSAEEWQQLWKSWDLITMTMIQHPGMLLEKPIDLRHPFLFYLGHIPAFLDIQLSKVFQEPFSEPKYFTEIFERGIDPDVEDPTQCHDHSKVPDSWPDVSEIIKYRDTVRMRLFKVLDQSKTVPLTRRQARVLFMTFEHESMHIETLLYMLVQSNNKAPPPGTRAPWEGLEELSVSRSSLVKDQPPPASWITIQPSRLDDESLLTLGHDDSEAADLKNPHDLVTPFGWDNEHPKIRPTRLLESFQIQSRQVTNAEYLIYLQSSGISLTQSNIPASWMVMNEREVFIKTVYGLVPLATVAGSWPVSCSANEAKAYAQWFDPSGGLVLPSEQQLSLVFKLKQKTCPDLAGSNYGFKRWFPAMTLTSSANQKWEPKQQQQQDDEELKMKMKMRDFDGPGGLWDWTSTLFAPVGDLSKSEFETSKLYPGYSTDFFDGKHQVVLGASWATHPRIAERRSFRNWYQPNYPYVFAGFRLVKKVVVDA